MFHFLSVTLCAGSMTSSSECLWLLCSSWEQTSTKAASYLTAAARRWPSVMNPKINLPPSTGAKTQVLLFWTYRCLQHISSLFSRFMVFELSAVHRKLTAKNWSSYWLHVKILTETIFHKNPRKLLHCQIRFYSMTHPQISADVSLPTTLLPFAMTQFAEKPISLPKTSQLAILYQNQSCTDYLEHGL